MGAAHLRTDIFDFPCPGTISHGGRSFQLGSLIIWAAGLIVGFAVLAAAACFLFLNDEIRHGHNTPDEFTENDFENISG